ncbi:MAG: transposase [Labilibaculum sp.]|nr:transposase [Labilibaculum sp.]
MSYKARCTVSEVGLDIVKKSFPKGSKVIDCFHIQKLAYLAVQDVRMRSDLSRKSKYSNRKGKKRI